MGRQIIDYQQDETARDAVEQLKSHFSGRDAGYYIKTFGCQMNAHDSEHMAGLLEAMGLTPRNSAGDADVVLVNTCCVREHAEVKVFGNVGAYCKLKEAKKNMIIGVCGCMMQQKHMLADMRSRFPGVNFYMGTRMIHQLPQVMLESLRSGHRQDRVANPTGPVVEGLPAVRSTPLSAFVNITFGCDNFCSYCIVPMVRGRERSREPRAILEEITALAQKGCLEVTLLGQNVNSYGRGLDGEMDFAGLLRRVNEIDGIRRVRFMTSHPKDLSEALMDAMAQCGKVCPQLHLPVQSGSDPILSAMNRGYTRAHYVDLVERLREKIPGIGLSTDMIVGFPGETDADFEQTLSLMETVRYDSAFLFKYSVRKGTAAEKLVETVPEEVKKQRLSRLIDLQESISDERNAQYVDSVREVLAESLSARDPGAVSGRTPEGRMVNIGGASDLIGEIVPVRITEAKAHTLFGEIIREER